jgi:hypothetical protein
MVGVAKGLSFLCRHLGVTLMVCYIWYLIAWRSDGRMIVFMRAVWLESAYNYNLFTRTQSLIFLDTASHVVPGLRPSIIAAPLVSCLVRYW